MNNKFSKFFFEVDKKFLISKWNHYFDIYERHFNKFIGKEPVIVEIGVADGGSLEMWNYYFDNKCKIYGIDINPSCKKVENTFPNVTILIGDQNDDIFLDRILNEIPPIDILIDDGSHIQQHLIKGFQKLYQHIKPGGIYLIEDLHTSYWHQYGGGLKKPDSFIEFSKSLIDELNAFHIQENVDKSFAIKTDSLHYYDSIFVIERKVHHSDPISLFR